MSVGALSLRLRFAARPFESSELDSLVSRMSVLEKMSTNPKDRWFIGRGSAAYSSKTRVIFGRRFYERLTEAQRLAVAAHELVHIREGDAGYAERHVTIPALVCWLGPFLVSLALWRIFFVAAILGLVGLELCLFSSIYSIRGWRRAAELRCDVVAASFVDGQDLIAALRILDAFISPAQRRGLSYRLAHWMLPYPSLGEREEAIGRVTKESDSL